MFRRKPGKTIAVTPVEENTALRKSVAFSVDLDNNTNRGKLPSRLENRLSASKTKPSSEITYSDDESRLMAEIMREATIQDIKSKAGKVDHRIYDANRRRMCFDSIKEQTIRKKESESISKVPDIRERQRIVKEMANTARRKASAEKRTSAT